CDEKYGAFAQRQLESLAPAAVENPFAFGQTIAGLDRLVRGATDIVILGGKDDERANALHRPAFAAYLPNRNSVWADRSGSASMSAAPLLTADKPAGAGPVAYVCRGRTCSPPVRTAAELTALGRP